MPDSDTTKPKKAAKKATKKAPAKKAAKSERAPRTAAKKTGKTQVETPPQSSAAAELLGAVSLDDRPILVGDYSVRLVNEGSAARTLEDAVDEFIEMVNTIGLRRLLYLVEDEETGEVFALRGDRSGEILRGDELDELG